MIALAAAPAAGWHIVAWKSGLVEIVADDAPQGAIALFRLETDDAALSAVHVIDAIARHAYRGDQRLVPGVPEAEDDEKALDALIAWHEQLLWRLERTLPPQSFASLRFQS
jgi:hypothetical protein